MACCEGYVITEEIQIATIVKIMAAIIMCWVTLEDVAYKSL